LTKRRRVKKKQRVKYIKSYKKDLYYCLINKRRFDEKWHLKTC